MSVRITRIATASVVIAGAVGAVLSGSVSASAETVKVDSRGTGQALGDREIVTDEGTIYNNPYKAEIFPIPGQITPYNTSVDGGVHSGVRLAIVKSDQGDTVYVTGYSQGARVAGDIGEVLDRFGVSKNRKVIVITKSDPRQPGGVETVYQPYTDLLPNKGYPFVQFQGVRSTEGEVQTVRYCTWYDGVGNTADFFDNPGAAVASLVGYATGWHDYSDIDKYPTTTVVRDGGYTVNVIIDKGNPLVELGDQAATTLTGKPLTDSQQELIEAATPIGEPGSGEQVTPDPERIADAAGNVVEEAYVEYAPEVVNTAVNGVVTGQTGNPVLGDIAGDVAQQVAEPIVEATAPYVGDAVADAVQPAVEQGLAALQQAGAAIKNLPPLPGLPVPGH